MPDQTNNLLLDVLSSLPDPVFIITESGRYVAIIGGHDRQFYHDGSHLVNFTLHDVLSPEKANWFLQQIQITLTEQHLRLVEYPLSAAQVQGIVPDTGPAGELWFEGRIQPLPNMIEGERAVIWVASNITERHKLAQQLQYLSETDELTGVYNRRKLLHELNLRLAESLRYQLPFSLIIFDIDFFKRVNDRYGHIAGDSVLQEMSNLCREQLRAADILGRLGGEEFALALPNTRLEEACQTAERFRRLIDAHAFSIGAHVSISLGIAEFDGTDTKIENLLKRADSALYKAKKNGRNQWQTDQRPATPLA
ncbi:sensor domain-containing diguanylate cyclase [Gilvimarinus sp. DA14]|uniref:GGDEF domain-containing protein n=1 Tax=Gilvimarinus sp. DA14 TaxID=2956798 RepID=UPI0020B75D60|nr:sensor domain-containing diguanylate cyclase [Gilvimarinus sp. DA14]UTF58814.1 GGDEF domain-containing protein [Gilvimarinus sp. DA14]